jgi:hypothetical protein
VVVHSIPDEAGRNGQVGAGQRRHRENHEQHDRLGGSCCVIKLA